MAEVHLDHPGEMSWWVGHGPAPILGDCPHTCEHRDTSTVAYGPDYAHYELVVCIEADGCAGACRGWHAVVPLTGPKAGLAGERWHGFKAFDATREHITTRAERALEDARRDAERDAARLADIAARVPR